MRLRKDHKLVIALVQVAIVALAFVLTNSLIALVLYLGSEVSIAELSDFFIGLFSGEGVAIIGYHFFHRMKDKLWRLLNEERDSEVVSTEKLNWLKSLLRK